MVALVSPASRNPFLYQVVATSTRSPSASSIVMEGTKSSSAVGASGQVMLTCGGALTTTTVGEVASICVRPSATVTTAYHASPRVNAAAGKVSVV